MASALVRCSLVVCLLVGITLLCACSGADDQNDSSNPSAPAASGPGGSAALAATSPPAGDTATVDKPRAEATGASPASPADTASPGDDASTATPEVDQAQGLPPVESPPYQQLDGVPSPVNRLGHLLAQEQRSVVTPGGTPDNPGYSADDQTDFDNHPARLAAIVASVKKSPAFKAGIASLKKLSQAARKRALDAFETPLYPTWEMNGHIGPDGTTTAGFAVERKIATKTTNAVRAALK